MTQDTPTSNTAGDHTTASSLSSSSPSYYQRHIFFCINKRAEGESCCADHNAEDAAGHCKKAVKKAGLSGAGKVRVNKAACLDRCAAGPVCVVYPEAVWYSYVDNHDIDEIVESHLQNGKIVERLLVAPDVGK